MGKLFIIFCLLLIAIGIGWGIHKDSGDVLITFHNWQLETSVWLAALVILIIFIVFYALIRIIVGASHWSRFWRRRKPKDPDKPN